MNNINYNNISEEEINTTSEEITETENQENGSETTTNSGENNTPDTTLAGEVSATDNYETLVLTLTNGYYNYFTSVLENTDKAKVTPLVACNPGDKFRVTSTSKYNVAIAVYFDINNNVIGCYGLPNISSVAQNFKDVEIITPANCSFVAFQTHIDGNLKVEKHIATNSKFKNISFEPIRPREYTIGTRYIVNVTAKIVSAATQNSQGALANWQSLLMPCKKGDIFRVSGYIPAGLPSIAVAVLVNKDETTGSLNITTEDANASIFGIGNLEEAVTLTNRLIIIPNNVTHIAFTSFHSLTKGIDLHIEKPVSINMSDNISGLLSHYHRAAPLADPLYGKRLYVNGDSIAQGGGAGHTGYGELIARRHNMILTNDAEGGTTIAVNNNIESNIEYKSIYERVITLDPENNLEDRFDYILLEGGFNDMFNAEKETGNNTDNTENTEPNPKLIPLGSLTDENVTSFDTSTTLGATEAMCKYLNEHYPDTPKLFILGHKKNNQYQSTFWNGIKSALEKWGIPYIDFSEDITLDVSIAEINNTYFNFAKDDNEKYIFVGDTSHPNIKGYDYFFVPTIEEKLLSM